jgi:protein NrfD
MREEIIVSGRMNPMVDPNLHIWHWQIPLYLFLGGLAAGILFFAALYYITGKEKDYPTAVKLAPFVTPFLLIMGLIALFIDLRIRRFFGSFIPTSSYNLPCPGVPGPSW